MSLYQDIITLKRKVCELNNLVREQMSKGHKHSNKAILDAITYAYTTELNDKLTSLKNYELPIASKTTLGGIKVGDNLVIDENGFLHSTGGGKAYSFKNTVEGKGAILKTPQTGTEVVFKTIKVDENTMTIKEDENSITLSSKGGSGAITTDETLTGEGSTSSPLTVVKADGDNAGIVKAGSNIFIEDGVISANSISGFYTLEGYYK